MLKIKKGITLEDLEKYGFYLDDWGDYTKELVTKKEFPNTTLAIMIDNSSGSRRLGIITDKYYCFDIELDTLFDMIQDGIVEKVSNNECK